MAKFILPRQYSRVIQFELNEIARPLIDQMILEGELPHFAHINKNWVYCETSSEASYEHIEPWIQWVTAHTGKTFAEHGVFHLSDVARLQYPQIWEILSKQGIESGIIGSMNAMRRDTVGGFFFPDPWSEQGETYPASLQPLWDLISAKVQTHATSSVTLKDALKGLKVCAKLRLPLSLYLKIAVQFVRQKLNPKKKWKLAGLFDLFLTAIFKRIVKTTQFGFYTLFLNAMAHYQHHYWRNFDSSLFDKNIVSPDCDENDDPIRYGLKLYDRIISEAISLAKDPNTLVMITTGFSQLPFTEQETQGGMNYYRLLDHAAFAQCLGLKNCRILPLMSRDWQVICEDAEYLQHVQQRLSQISVSGEPLFRVEQNKPNSLFVETALTRAVKSDERIQAGGNDLGCFSEHFVNIAIKSGHHHGVGSLWVSDKNIQLPAQMPLAAIFSLSLSALNATGEFASLLS